VLNDTDGFMHGKLRSKLMCSESRDGHTMTGERRDVKMGVFRVCELKLMDTTISYCLRKY